MVGLCLRSLLTLALLVFGLLAATAARAEPDLPGCIVCRHDQCEPSPFDDWGAAICERMCEDRCRLINGATVCSQVCACRASGDCSDDYGGGPAYDAPPPWAGRIVDAIRAAEREGLTDPALALLLRMSPVTGPFAGQIAIDGETFHPFDGTASGGARYYVLELTVEGYPPLRRLDLELSADGHGVLGVTAEDGQRWLTFGAAR